MRGGCWRPGTGRRAPGATLGLVRDGALALHESAGQASLEHGVPIGPETRFRIASVSKQFTCAAILLLAAEGRLAVGDDIREYLPELPDFGARISIDQSDAQRLRHPRHAGADAAGRRRPVPALGAG